MLPNVTNSKLVDEFNAFVLQNKLGSAIRMLKETEAEKMILVVDAASLNRRDEIHQKNYESYEGEIQKLKEALASVKEERDILMDKFNDLAVVTVPLADRLALLRKEYEPKIAKVKLKEIHKKMPGIIVAADNAMSIFSTDYSRNKSLRIGAFEMLAFLLQHREKLEKYIHSIDLQPALEILVKHQRIPSQLTEAVEKMILQTKNPNPNGK
jgi:protein required for attachment to host cells